MDRVHWLFVIIGLLALVESLWTIARPRRIQDLLRDLVPPEPGLCRLAAALTFAVALACWWIAMPARSWEEWLAVAIGVGFALGAGLWFSPPSASAFCRFWILDPSPRALRARYILVMAAGAGLAVLGISRL